MPPPNSSVLEQLYRLDKSSAAFHDRLGGILDGEEYKQSVPDLQTNDLLWLVDYLDKVRLRASIRHSPLKSVQALDGLSPTSASLQKCLREFRDMQYQDDTTDLIRYLVFTSEYRSPPGRLRGSL